MGAVNSWSFQDARRLTRSVLALLSFCAICALPPTPVLADHDEAPYVNRTLDVVGSHAFWLSPEEDNGSLFTAAVGSTRSRVVWKPRRDEDGLSFMQAGTFASGQKSFVTDKSGNEDGERSRVVAIDLATRRARTVARGRLDQSRDCGSEVRLGNVTSTGAVLYSRQERIRPICGGAAHLDVLELVMRVGSEPPVTLRRITAAPRGYFFERWPASELFDGDFPTLAYEAGYLMFFGLFTPVIHDPATGLTIDAPGMFPALHGLFDLRRDGSSLIQAVSLDDDGDSPGTKTSLHSPGQLGTGTPIATRESINNVIFCGDHLIEFVEQRKHRVSTYLLTEPALERRFIANRWPDAITCDGNQITFATFRDFALSNPPRLRTFELPVTG